MIDTLGYVRYSNVCPLKGALWIRSVHATTYALLIPGAEYFTSNKRSLRFEPVTSCHVSSCQTRTNSTKNI